MEIYIKAFFSIIIWELLKIFWKNKDKKVTIIFDDN